MADRSSTFYVPSIYAKNYHEDTLQRLIAYSAWQRKAVLLVLCTTIPISWHLVSNVYLAPRTRLFCRNTTTGNDNICSCEDEKHVYDRRFLKETVLTEWELVCDWKHWGSFTQAIVLLGALLGGPVAVRAAEKCGKRNGLIVINVVLVGSGLLVGFMPNFWSYNLMRFVTGFASGSLFDVGSVYLLDIIGLKWLAVIYVILAVLVVTGFLIMSVTAYAVKTWRTLYIILSSFSVVSLLCSFLLPKSPRWLLSKNRIKEATDILKGIAKNKTKSVVNLKIIVEEHLQNLKKDEVTKRKKKKRDKKIKVWTVILWYNHFASSFCLYGAVFYTSTILENVLAAGVAVSLASLPGLLVQFWSVKNIGIKWTVFYCHVLTFVSFVSIEISQSHQAQFFWVIFTVAIAVVNIVTVRMYVDGICYNNKERVWHWTICLLAHRTGGMIAPFLVDSRPIYQWLPASFFCGTMFLAGISILFVSEIVRQQIPRSGPDDERNRENAKLHHLFSLPRIHQAKLYSLYKRKYDKEKREDGEEL